MFSCFLSRSTSSFSFVRSVCPSASASASSSSLSFRPFSTVSSVYRSSSLRSRFRSPVPPPVRLLTSTHSSLHRVSNVKSSSSSFLPLHVTALPRWLSLTAAAHSPAIQLATANVAPNESAPTDPASSDSNVSPSSSPRSLLSSLSLPAMFPALPIGLIAGFVGSMSGIGGAVVLVPAVSTLLRYDQRHAAAIGVLGSAATAFTGFFTYAANNCVHVPAAICICVGASLTIGFGARLATHVQNRTLQWILAFVFLGLAPLVMLGVYQKHFATKPNDEEEISGIIAPLGIPTQEAKHPKLFQMLPIELKHFPYSGPSPLEDSLTPYAALLAGGGGLGFLNGLLGMGGATTLNTVLSLTADSHKLPYAAIAGTCLSAIIVPSFLGTYKHYKLGNLRTGNLPALIGGVVIGALGGAEAAIHLPEAWVRSIFAVFLLLNGVRSINTLVKHPKMKSKPKL